MWLLSFSSRLLSTLVSFAVRRLGQRWKDFELIGINGLKSCLIFDEIGFLGRFLRDGLRKNVNEKVLFCTYVVYSDL